MSGFIDRAGFDDPAGRIRDVVFKYAGLAVASNGGTEDEHVAEVVAHIRETLAANHVRTAAISSFLCGVELGSFFTSAYPGRAAEIIVTEAMVATHQRPFIPDGHWTTEEVMAAHRVAAEIYDEVCAIVFDALPA
jgi:hypothetical protein